MGRLLIFDTHPIQYRSPVFKEIRARRPDFKVYFFNHQFNGNHWWFHEVGKIPEQTWGLSLQDGFANEVIGTRALGLKGAWQAFRRILETERPEQVGVYGYYQTEHWMLRLLCARRGIPMIFVGETFLTGRWSLRRLIKMPLRAFFFKGVTHFIAIGKKTLDYYRSLGVAETRLVPAKYCIDLSFFKQPPELAAERRALWRLRFDIPADAVVLLFVGRLFERKRPQDVIEIHRRLAANPNVFTVMVGNGPLDESLRESTRGLDRLIWAGFQNQAGTRDAYYGADVLIVPSEYETWGLVVNEAAACGLPAAVTDTCGVAEDLTQDGRTGVVFPRGDIAAAVTALSCLIEYPDCRKRLGDAARQLVEKEYDVGQFADAFVKAIPAR